MIALIATLIFIPFAISVIISFPAVQTRLVNWISHQALKSYGVELEIGEVSINYYLDVVVSDVRLYDHNGRLLSSVDEVTVDMRRLSLKTHKLEILRLTLLEPKVDIRILEGDSLSNLDYVLRKIAELNPPDTTGGDPWSIDLDQLTIAGMTIIYDDMNHPSLKKGFDENHIRVQELNADIALLRFDSTAVSLLIEKFSGSERGGLQVINLRTGITMTKENILIDSLSLTTPGSDIKLDGRLSIADASLVNNFIDRFSINFMLAPSVLDMSDIILFSPELEGMENILHIEGQLRGKISSLKARNFRLDYGKETRFLGDITLSGLPDLNETFIHLSIQELRTTLDDISKLRIPGDNVSIADLNIPAELKRLGSIRMNGSLTGFYYDFVSNAAFQTDLGAFTTDISIKEGEKLSDILYNGKLKINGFDIGEFLDDDNYVGTLTLNASVNGQGIGPDADIVIDGVIDSINILKYNYDRITINGHYVKRVFDGSLSVADKDINFDFVGLVDWSGDVPVFDFEADIRNTHLAVLNILEGEGDPMVDVRVEADFSGIHPDSMIGSVLLEGLHYRNSERSIHSERILVNTYRPQGLERVITLNSEFINAELNGRFVFSDIIPIGLHIASGLIPSLMPDSLPAFPTGRSLAFKAEIMDADSLIAFFAPGLSIPANMVFEGSINPDGKISLLADAPRVNWKENVLYEVDLEASGNRNKMVFAISSEHLFLSDSLQMSDPLLSGSVMSDSLLFSLSWDDAGIGTPNEAELNGFLDISQYPVFQLWLDDSWFKLNDSLWEVSQSQLIRFDTTSIFIDRLSIASRAMAFSVSGSISPDPESTLLLEFKEYNVSDLDFLTNKYQFDLDGILNGSAELKNLLNEPNILSNITIKGLAFNDDKLGDAAIRSTWDRSRNAAFIDAGIITTGNIGSDTTLKVKGFFTPTPSQGDQFDLAIDLKNFRIHTLQNFLLSITSDLRGIASGRIFLKGSLAEPELTGRLMVIAKQLKIDYLNTHYSFANEVRFEPGYIEFDSVLVNDNNGPHSIGNTAIFDGRIYHDHFRDWKLDLNIKSDKITMLNTARSLNEYYYGKAVASGDFNIIGPVDDISIRINAQTESGTVFAIPLTYPENISSSDFIRFIGSGSESLEDTITRQLDLSGIRMGFDLAVTPDAEVQLIFDEKIGDVIKGNGNADLSLEIDTRGQFEMFGAYVIQKGEYLFTLQNVINKRFDIMPGGTINWTGDPYDADIDIEAVYTVHTSLYSLGLDLDTSRRRIPVQCKLHLTGKLMQPDIDRSIEFPGMNTFEAEQYKAAIQPNLNYQFLSLLVVNSFIYAGGDKPGIGTFSGSGLVGANSYEFISNQISNWLSTISSDFDIGLNYRPEDNLSNEQLQVILSTQLFNDRLSIDGNIDVGGNQSAGSIQGSQNTSNIVGDVNLEYKITPEGKFKIKAYNRSNYRDPLNSTAPYTQGVGVFYRKEFDHFGDLFRRKNKEEQIK